MATVIKEFILATGTDAVWDALADFGALHTRLVPGFVTDTSFDGNARIVTFANGAVARETLVTRDAERRRLVYAVAPGERLAHYSAAAQVFDAGNGRARFVWTADFLPDALEPYIGSQMDLGVAAMKKAFGAGAQGA
jgi:hypothetical protein